MQNPHEFLIFKKQEQKVLGELKTNGKVSNTTLAAYIEAEKVHEESTDHRLC